MNRLILVGAYCASALFFGLMCWMLGDILRLGISRLSLDFLLSEPEAAGRLGGIAPILLSTFWIIGIAIAAAVPIGLALAIWQVEYKSKAPKWFQKAVPATLHILAAVPSIVYGLFGYAFFCVFLGFGYSILAGGLTLACMILPFFASVAINTFESVPLYWRQGARALGIRQITYVFQILVPNTIAGLTAGLSLSFARATAETAALLFTSGYVDRYPESAFDSGRALSVHIYELAMNVTGANPSAYSAALVLVIAIFSINIFAQGVLQWKWFNQGFTNHRH